MGPIRSFDASLLPSRVAGEVPVGEISATWLRQHLCQHHELPDDLAGQWERDGTLRDRKVSFALLAAAEAWRASGCAAAQREAWLSISLGMEQVFLEDLVPVLAGPTPDWSSETQVGLPRERLRSRFDSAAEAVKQLLDLRGLMAVHASACAGGALALAHAASLVERGATPLVLAGGADSMINSMSLGGISRLGAPSPRNEPDACRPFDRRRDGMVIGEGAAFFVVESEHHARERGARPLAVVLGWGSSQDAYRLSAPRPDGAAARVAMERALGRARLSPREVAYVNAHGTGTLLNDVAEARAIRAAFGACADTIPVSSIKGAVGHLMSAAGSVEAAACLLALAGDVLPGTAHHRERDEECALDVIGETPRAVKADVVLSNSFGFGGQNCSIILGRHA